MNICCTNDFNHVLVSIFLLLNKWALWRTQASKYVQWSLPSNIMCKCNDYTTAVDIAKLVTEKNISSTKFPTISNEESCGQCLRHNELSNISGCQSVLTSYHFLLYDIKQSTKLASQDDVYRTTKIFSALTMSFTSLSNVFWMFYLRRDLSYLFFKEIKHLPESKTKK